jgi:threonine dehydrogenase-like Zn-dependent dehydrogenase
LIDNNPSRADVARTLGVPFALPAGARPEADLIVHASGSADGLALALQVAGFEATILELSWYGDRPITLPLGGAFHSRRLTLKASQVGSVSPSHRPRWTHARRLRLALALLQAAELDVLVNSESRFSDLPAVMGQLARGGGTVIMHRVVYE